MNKKGFTLIEVLAVIVIIGVIMIVAVPAVSNYIIDSRDSAYVSTAQKFIDAAVIDVNNREYVVDNLNYTYYIPTKCLETDNGHESPYDIFDESYVVVVTNEKNHDYYYAGRDVSNHGILITYREILSEDEVRSDVNSIDTSIGVGNRTQIMIYSDTCDGSRTQVTATKTIEEHGKLK